LRSLLAKAGDLRIVVVGDFFLDAYYDCDPRLNEPSVETGLTAYQVVRTRRQAGAAGTVVANLTALGCGHIDAVSYHGDDGEGFELRRALDTLGADTSHFICAEDRVTPTYGKPCLVEQEDRGRWRVTEELQRLDTKNRRPTPAKLQTALIEKLQAYCQQAHAVIVVDQVREPNCGVITTRVRREIEALSKIYNTTVFIADSRERIGLFRHVSIKPNLAEAQKATKTNAQRSIGAAASLLRRLRGKRDRPCFCTLSTRGMIVSSATAENHVAAFPVPGPTDPVGAGDSTTASIACVLAAGGSAQEAALVANLAASITVQQIGTTGTASPEQIIDRYRELGKL